MVNKTLTVSIFIVFSLLALFFIWHFLLSIYEVKFILSPESGFLNKNQNYEIEAVALNSLGWEIRFRDLYCEYQILEGSDLIEVKTTSQNKFKLIAKSVGKVNILANSKYSLNPSIIKLSIEE